MNFKVSQLKSLTAGEVAVDDLIYVIDSNPTDGSVKSKKVTVGDLIDSRIYGISSSQFVLITGYYADPSWITSLDWSKITNAPSFVTSLSALTDVQLSTPLVGQALVYNGSKWVNQGIGELDTLNSVTTRGNTTTNSISTGNITASASNIASLTLVDTLQPYAWSFRNNGTNLLFVNNGGTNIVKLTAGGNVLVGTNTDSGYKLDVNGSTRVSGSMTVNDRYLYHQGNSAIQYFMTSNAWSGTNSIFFGDDSSSVIGSITYNHQFDSLAFTVNGSNALHINSSRNIGIGTTSPTNAVHIRTAAGGATSNYALVWQESTGDRVLGYLGADNSAFFSGALYLYQNGVSNTKITANGTSYLMGGNVLVGTNTDAGYKLDVNGTARFSGNTYLAGDILVSNGSGTRYIQSPNGSIGFLSSNSSGYNLFADNSKVGIKSELYITSDLNYNTGIRLRIGSTQTSPFGYSYELSFQPQVNHVPTYTAIRTLDSTYGGNSTTPSPIYIFGGQNTTSGVYAHVILQSDFTTSRGNVAVGTTTALAKFTVAGSITAASALAQGVYFNNTLVAAANNDVLVGLDINPTFTNGAFTGVTGYGLRVKASLNTVNQTDYVASFENTHPLYGNGIQIIGAGDKGGARLLLRAANNDETNVFRILGNGSISVGTGNNSNAGTIVNNAAISLGGYQTISHVDSTGIVFSPFSSANAVTFRQGGNVLIGTTTDSGYKFDVNGTVRFQDHLIFSSTKGIYASTALSTVLQSSTNYFTHNRIASSGTLGYQIAVVGNVQSFWRYNDGTGDVEFGNANGSYHLGLYAGNTERVKILGNGNVGIGTVSPSYKLDVTGDARIQKSNGANLYLSETGGNAGDVAGLYLTGNNSTWGGSIRYNVGPGGAINRLDLYHSLANIGLSLISSGNVSIGTTTDLARLTVRGSGSTSATNALLIQNSSGTQLFKLSDDGTINTSYSAPLNCNFALNVTYDISCRGIYGNSGALSLIGASAGNATGTMVNISYYGSPAGGNIGTSLKISSAVLQSAVHIGLNFNGDYTSSVGSNTLIGYNFAPTNYGTATLRAFQSAVGGVYVNTTSYQASAILQADSTTQGFLAPRLTTAQILAITSPAEGLQVYNTDLHVICFYDGTAWKKVSHSNM